MYTLYSDFSGTVTAYALLLCPTSRTISEVTHHIHFVRYQEKAHAKTRLRMEIMMFMWERFIVQVDPNERWAKIAFVLDEYWQPGP